jgi:long-chain acyl-CoA synthetase
VSAITDEGWGVASRVFLSPGVPVDSASMATSQPRSVGELFLDRVGRTPEALAFTYPEGSGWRKLTWADTEVRVRAVACGLRAIGLAHEDVAAILSGTRIEWVLADLGILCAGGATSTIYPSSTVDECAYILGDSAAVVCFAENEEQVAKLLSRREQLPALRRIVVFEGAPSSDGFVIPFSALEDLGRARDQAHPGEFEETCSAVEGDSLATLIYTSGTTGPPKGVELTHACWLAQSAAIEETGILDHEHVSQLFWLPLAHSFGKMIGTAQLRVGFPTVVDGRVEKLVENLGHFKPTFVCAVPRIFEKVHAKVVFGATHQGRARAALFRWAIDVGLAAGQRRREGEALGPLLDAQHRLADRLVFRKVRQLFGGRLRFFISGSAPLSREVAQFFDAMGVVILEGYGLTESSAATHCNLPWNRKLGTVGPAFPGTEVKLASDGEVLMRGPWIMRRYHARPEATAEALDAEGWLHTGDVGVIDEQGRLSITDRKKDLIKTSGGKYIAPTELENQLKAATPLLSQVLVHGEQRHYVTALVTLDPEALQRFAAQRDLGDLSGERAAAHQDVHRQVQRAVEQVNAALPRFATIKRFTILPREFSEAEGEVTPSQKVKRRMVEQRYRVQLDAMYP